MKKFFNICHIIIRGFILGVLSIYLHYFIFIFIFLLIIANLIASLVLIKTDCSKNIWTSFSSVLLPNAFISRATVEYIGKKNTKNIFLEFYKYNGLFFFIIIVIGGLSLINYFLLFNPLIKYDCYNLPFLSYAKVSF